SALGPAGAQNRRATDFQGDPLPQDAVARLSSNRGRHGNNPSDLRFSLDNTRLATLADDGAVRLWEAASARELHVFRGESPMPAVRCFAFAPDRKTLATGGEDGVVRFYDLATGRQVRRLSGNGAALKSLAFSPNGKILALAGEDNSVYLR